MSKRQAIEHLRATAKSPRGWLSDLVIVEDDYGNIAVYQPVEDHVSGVIDIPQAVNEVWGIFERCNPQPEPVKSAMTITQDQLEQAAQAVCVVQNHMYGGQECNSDWPIATAALTALGIIVEEEDE